MKNMPLELVRMYKILAEKPLLEDFYHVPFIGTISSAFGYRQSLVYIGPTHENNKAIQARIHEYIKEVRDESDKKVPILTDEEALKQDLAQKIPVIYGTWKGNLFLATHLSNHPVVIESNFITADEVYKGAQLRFITAWPNPRNQEKGMVIYTAQRAEDIVGINSLFHGETDYVIGSGTDVLRKANYKKQNDKWTFH